jgi:hypothetical protein
MTDVGENKISQIKMLCAYKRMYCNSPTLNKFLSGWNFKNGKYKVKPGMKLN